MEKRAPLILREMPAQRLAREGVGAVAKAELIVVVTGCLYPEAEALLSSCDGSLKRLATMSGAQIAQTKGFSALKAGKLLASLELGRRMSAEEREDGAPIRGPRDVHELMAPRMADLPVEEFHVLILDSQHRLERDQLITRGLLNSSLVHPREVFRESIAANAAAIILVHNHPSGDPTPSPDDRITTEQLVSAGRVLDIPVHDHIIIGRGRYLSFAEAGLL